MTNTTGGYYLHREALTRAGTHRHTAALKNPVSQLDLDAINAIQAVPWAINQRVLEIAAHLNSTGQAIAGLPGDATVAIPERLTDEEWQAKTPEERKDYTATKRRAFENHASLAGARQRVLDQLDGAEELRDQPAVYFPHSRDFRGRMYPIPMSGPHPQSDDLGKALLQFARGQRLGADGLYWLCIKAAGHSGNDKLHLKERMAWTIKHLNEIMLVAVDPLDPEIMSWWTEMDEPFQFLSVCFELAEACALSDPLAEDFVSYLPVHVDGTCNGLQHLSAMGLDPVGAKATNLCAGLARQDIYQEVADLIAAMVEDDARAGHEEAVKWLGKITRSTVKRAVMTTPYGVTTRGITRQLVIDRQLPGDLHGSEANSSASYLTAKLTDALDQTIQAGKAIMGWIQDCAKLLSDNGCALDWTTPTGSKVRQSYYQTTVKRVGTMVGTLQLQKEVDRSMLVTKKMALAAAPNVVHSFDASAMALTVARAVAAGIADFAMIHDSFGTHAGSMGAFGAILRQAFVDIYTEDQLARLHGEWQALMPQVELPPPPARGEFDITQVLKSEFFFS